MSSLPDKSPGLKIELSEDIKEKVIQDRNQFRQLFVGRYMELLPSLISYTGLPPSIDPYYLELLLRTGYDVVIGEDKASRLQVLGYVIDGDDGAFLERKSRLKRHTEKDIHFFIPKKDRQTLYTELSFTDGCKIGNFAILRNKPINLVSDYAILNLYADELAEISNSRFSLAIQSKASTFFVGEKGDETINQLVSDLYNGSPYVKVTKYFDPKEQIVKLDRGDISSLMENLKKEYQNKLSELNSMLGITTLAVEKESGVSETEANGNNNYSKANSNIYLAGREEGLRKLNLHYALSIQPVFNDAVRSELLNLRENEEKNEDDSNLV